jgi:hypothetical protein
MMTINQLLNQKKKAMITLNVMKVIILGLASLIILMALLYQMGGFLKNAVDDSSCKTSININRAAHVKGLSFDFNDLNCPINYITIDKKKELDIYREISEEMRRCYNLFGEGAYDLFDKNGIYCSVCSVIDFKDKYKEYDDLYKYLERISMVKSHQTYIEYLVGFESEDAIKNVDYSKVPELENVNFVIDTNELYSVVFVYVRGKNSLGKFKDSVGKFKASLLGFGATAAVGTGIVVAATGGVAALPIAIVGAVSLASGVLVYFYGEDPAWISMVLFKEHNPEDFTNLGCEFYPSIQKEKLNE